MYETPDLVGWYTAQIALTNAQGNRIEVDFQIRVQTSGLTANIGPVVRGFTGKRTPAGVRWAANVSFAGDGTGLSYAWQFTDAETNAGTFTDAGTNPTILTGYSVATAGTLSVTVTDAARPDHHGQPRGGCRSVPRSTAHAGIGNAPGERARLRSGTAAPTPPSSSRS